MFYYGCPPKKKSDSQISPMLFKENEISNVENQELGVKRNFTKFENS